MGLTWMKMDFGINVLDGIPGTVMQPSGMSKWELRDQPHPFIATEVTDKGIDRLCEYVAAVRDNIGYDMPLLDGSPRPHRRKVCHRLGKAYEKFNLEWMEDVIPWYYTDYAQGNYAGEPDADSHGRRYLQIEDFEMLCSRARGGQNSSRPCDLRRYSADASHWRHGFPLRSTYGDALCRNAGQLHGQRALRRGNAQLPRAREPFARCALLAGPGHRH
jgi:hypothetical protein